MFVSCVCVLIVLHYPSRLVSDFISRFKLCMAFYVIEKLQFKILLAL